MRPHPQLGTVEVRAFDAQVEVWRSEALITLTAALGDRLSGEYESGDLKPIRPNREIEENKWSAQRHGLAGAFSDHDTHKGTETRVAVGNLLDFLEDRTGRDLTAVRRILEEPTGADRQLEVWRETDSTPEVARDLAGRTRLSALG